MQSIKNILKKFNPMEDRYVSREYQSYGVYLAEKLSDDKHKSLYIKLARDIPRPVLEQALRFVADSGARRQGALFMWKLKEIGVMGKKPVKKSVEPVHSMAGEIATTLSIISFLVILFGGMLGLKTASNTTQTQAAGVCGGSCSNNSDCGKTTDGLQLLCDFRTYTCQLSREGGYLGSCDNPLPPARKGLRKLGQVCVQDIDCNSGLICSKLSQRDTNFVCVEPSTGKGVKRAAGDWCEKDNSLCQSGKCTNNYCSPGQNLGPGDSCNPRFTECAAGLGCTNGACNTSAGGQLSPTPNVSKQRFVTKAEKCGVYFELVNEPWTTRVTVADSRGNVLYDFDAGSERPPRLLVDNKNSSNTCEPFNLLKNGHQLQVFFDPTRSKFVLNATLADNPHRCEFNLPPGLDLSQRFTITMDYSRYNDYTKKWDIGTVTGSSLGSCAPGSTPSPSLTPTETPSPTPTRGITPTEQVLPMCLATSRHKEEEGAISGTIQTFFGHDELFPNYYFKVQLCGIDGAPGNEHIDCDRNTIATKVIPTDGKFTFTFPESLAREESGLGVAVDDYYYIDSTGFNCAQDIDGNCISIDKSQFYANCKANRYNNIFVQNLNDDSSSPVCQVIFQERADIDQCQVDIQFKLEGSVPTATPTSTPTSTPSPSPTPTATPTPCSAKVHFLIDASTTIVGGAGFDDLFAPIRARLSTTIKDYFNSPAGSNNKNSLEITYQYFTSQVWERKILHGPDYIFDDDRPQPAYTNIQEALRKGLYGTTILITDGIPSVVEDMKPDGHLCVFGNVGCMSNSKNAVYPNKCEHVGGTNRSDTKSEACLDPYGTPHSMEQCPENVQEECKSYSYQDAYDATKNSFGGHRADYGYVVKKAEFIDEIVDKASVKYETGRDMSYIPSDLIEIIETACGRTPEPVIPLLPTFMPFSYSIRNNSQQTVRSMMLKLCDRTTGKCINKEVPMNVAAGAQFSSAQTIALPQGAASSSSQYNITCQLVNADGTTRPCSQSPIKLGDGARFDVEVRDQKVQSNVRLYSDLADINGDCAVNAFDYSICAQQIAGNPGTDIDKYDCDLVSVGDVGVNTGDLTVVISNFGKQCDKNATNE